jgi:hypothetical protein
MIPLQTASGHPITHILFSPDGSTVAVAQPHHGVTLLERGTGHARAVCAMPRRAAFTGLTFCGAGRYLAASTAKGLEVFDTDTGAPVAACFSAPCKEVKLAERDGSVVGVGRGIAPVWRSAAADRTGFAWLPLKKAVAGAEVPAPDGHLAVGVAGPRSARRTVLLDLVTGRPVAELDRPERSAKDPEPVVRFCPLGLRFAINDGRTIDVSDAGAFAASDDEQPADAPLVQRASGTRSAVALRPHARLAPVFSLNPDRPGDASYYPPFALAPDGRGLLVKRPRNRIQLWDAPTGTLVNEWSWQFEWVTCVAVSPDGLTAVAGGRFGRVLLWDLE